MRNLFAHSYPPPTQVSWLYSYVLAAYGRLDSFDAVQLGVLFNALPTISPYPAWLDELVQIAASESSPLLRSRSGSMDGDDEAALLKMMGKEEEVEGDACGSSQGSNLLLRGQMGQPSPGGQQGLGLWWQANGGSGPVLQFDAPPRADPGAAAAEGAVAGKRASTDAVGVLSKLP